MIRTCRTSTLHLDPLSLRRASGAHTLTVAHEMLDNGFSNAGNRKQGPIHMNCETLNGE